jgi:hypothetical protein
VPDAAERLFLSVRNERFDSRLDPPPRDLGRYRGTGYADMLAMDLRQRPLTLSRALDLAFDDVADVWNDELEDPGALRAALRALVKEWLRGANSLPVGSSASHSLRAAATLVADVIDDLPPRQVIESIHARASRDHLYNLVAEWDATEGFSAQRAFVSLNADTALSLWRDSEHIEPQLEQLVEGLERAG